MGLIPGWGTSPRGGHGNPLQYSCLENPTDRGGWQATVHTESWTQLKRLSMHVTRVSGFTGGSLVKNPPAMQETQV